MTIVVKTSDCNEQKFHSGRCYNFKSFGKWLCIYDYSKRTIAIFKTSEVVGFWEE